MRKEKTKNILLDYSNILVLAAALLILVIVMSALSPYFLKTSFLWKQAGFVAETSLIGLGMTLVILTGGIDLSVGSVMALSAILTGMASGAGAPAPAAIAAGILFGAAAGFLNGVIICKAHVAPLIVTLGTMGLFRGIAMGISGGDAVKYPESLCFLGQGALAGIPVSFFLALALYAAAVYMLKNTKMGVNLQAIGYNEEGSRFSGIHVDKEKIRVYMISGILAALMGVIYAGRVSSAKADYGSGYEMNAITIAVFGGAVLSGGKASVPGSFAATVIIVLLKQGLTLANVQSELQSVIVGLILIFAVSFNAFIDSMGKSAVSRLKINIKKEEV